MSNSRLNRDSVEKQINEEKSKFYNRIYSGDVPVPESITKVFADAIFNGVTPQQHQIHVSSLRRLLDKPANKLTNIELGSMINVILSTKFSDLYPDLKTALEVYEGIEKVVIHYNDLVTKFNTSLEKKRQTLMQLIQPTGSGRIIAKA